MLPASVIRERLREYEATKMGAQFETSQEVSQDIGLGTGAEGYPLKGQNSEEGK